MRKYLRCQRSTYLEYNMSVLLLTQSCYIHSSFFLIFTLYTEAIVYQHVTCTCITRLHGSVSVVRTTIKVNGKC